MIGLNQAGLSDRTEEDIAASIELDEKGTSAPIDSITSDILESAQKSQEEGKIKVSKTPAPKETVSTIDYETFILPDQKDEYLKHVNQKDRKVHSEKILEKDNGTLQLHLFSIVTSLV
jgi:hypothetical protein